MKNLIGIFFFQISTNSYGWCELAEVRKKDNILRNGIITHRLENLELILKAVRLC